jgi:hypothetical protein
LMEGRSALLDDLTGSRLRVVTSARVTESEACEFERRLAPHEGCLVSIGINQPGGVKAIEVRETEGCLGRWLHELDRTFAIVRPDHYVYATAPTASEALNHLDAFTHAMQSAL